jgi:hypothetical protein
MKTCASNEPPSTTVLNEVPAKVRPPATGSGRLTKVRISFRNGWPGGVVGTKRRNGWSGWSCWTGRAFNSNQYVPHARQAALAPALTELKPVPLPLFSDHFQRHGSTIRERLLPVCYLPGFGRLPRPAMSLPSH